VNTIGVIRRRIRGFAPETEFGIVILGAFAYFCLGSVLSALFPGTKPPISQSHLAFLVIYESVVLLLLGSMLYLRGWTLNRIGLKITGKDTVVGIGLALVGYAGFVAVWWTAAACGIHASYPGSIQEIASHGLDLSSVIAVSILNPIYEETFLCGYILTDAKENKHLAAGMSVSLAIRLIYHLYQGSVGVLVVIPLGLAFSIWYARTGRLWPVIVAHGLFDVTGLIRFVGPN